MLVFNGHLGMSLERECMKLRRDAKRATGNLFQRNGQRTICFLFFKFKCGKNSILRL